jgi:membrane AbrB-like protein
LITPVQLLGLVEGEKRVSIVTAQPGMLAPAAGTGAPSATPTRKDTAVAARMAHLVPWVIGIAGGVTLGVLLKSISVPGPWILSFIISFGIVAFTTDKELQPRRNFINIAQATVALLAISPLISMPVGELAELLPYVVAITLIILVLSLALALLTYTVHRQKDALTIVLSMLPGASSAMTTMARELGADHRYVALIQYLRLLIVSLTLPIFMESLESGCRPMGDAAATKGVSNGAFASWQGLIGVAVILLAVPVITKIIPVRVPYIFIPMLIAIILAVSHVPGELWNPPRFLSIFAFAVIGIQAGGAFTRSCGLIQFAKFLPIALTAIAAMIGVCLGLAYCISVLTGVALPDAYLATTPGGLQVVLAFADETSAAPIALITQVARAIVMLIVPLLMTYVARTMALTTSSPSDKHAAKPASS